MLSYPVLNTGSPTEHTCFAETVCWLDIDPGQPEFSPPGQISLLQIRKPMFGPPFSHPYADASTPVRAVSAHSIAAVSPKDDPEHFLACTLDLLQQYQEILKRFPTCPLIVNCPGWVLGSALEIMTQLMRTTQMTDVVYMSDTGMPEVVDALRSAAGSATFTRLVAKFFVLPNRTSSEFRAMQYMSYFHQDEPSHNNLKWTVSSFTANPPLILKYAAHQADFLGIMTLGEHPTDAFLATVLEGSLVALVEVEDDEYASTLQQKLVRSEHENLPYWPPDGSGLTTPPDPSKTHMIALALLVRIDVGTKELVLRTPLPSVRFQKGGRTQSSTSNSMIAMGVPRIMLVRGRYDTPGWAYQEEIFRSMKGKTSTKKSTVPGENEEDLSIDERGLPRSRPTDLALGEEEEEEEEVVDVPWIKKLQHGEGADKRWRVRRDYGTRRN